MCTSVIVAANATTHRQNIVSRNEDCERDIWNKYFVYRQQPEYANEKVIDDGLWHLGNGLKVPKPTQAFSYSAAPDFDANNEASSLMPAKFLYEERGINEKNVAMSATNTLAMNDKAAQADPLLKQGGITEAVIPTLILPQAESARHGIQLLGQYIEQYGSAEVNGVTIADVNEIWYFENGSCHHWLAVKVPADSYLVVANAMRIHDIDLDSPEVLHSPGLYEFVCQHQLLPDADKHHFNFAKAFGVTGQPYNVDRIWLAQLKLTPSLAQPPRQQQYPLFLKPDALVSVPDVISVLTATYEGTELEGKANRPIGYDKTAESHIITLDKQQCHELQGVIWQAVSTPLCAMYLPFFGAVQSFPASYHSGTNNFDAHGAYWAYRTLFTLAYAHQQSAVSGIGNEIRAQEIALYNELTQLMPNLATMMANSTAQTISFLNRYTLGNCDLMLQFAHQRRNQLMNDLATIAPATE
ncbi:C69 family dipeptidase [Pseudoalteromonas sp. T1lg88]|uniref:C69 family dipeptidase n=1 Tax=Pseudoalteromonas sp. T1lg88 TaxID=2077104 RepID=UPI000CF6507A|nr:C69 family dipeptidase [Pseudoalteromonas sp. T1lg88]